MDSLSVLGTIYIFKRVPKVSHSAIYKKSDDTEKKLRLHISCGMELGLEHIWGNKDGAGEKERGESATQF